MGDNTFHVSTKDEGDGRQGVPLKLRKRSQWMSAVAGVILVVAGTVAVFITGNGVGAAALLAVGALFLYMGVSGYVVRFKGGGTEISPAMADAVLTTAKLHTAVDVGAFNPEAGQMVMHDVLARVALERGLKNPYAIAEQLSGGGQLRADVERAPSLHPSVTSERDVGTLGAEKG